MYISKVIIENFQSHRRTELDLSHGVTILVGESDRGKSAVIRALRWLFENEPRGTGFMRTGSGTTRVTAVLDSGVQIIRERTPSKNRYIVIKNDGEEEIYERFGSEIPPEIKALHGVSPVKLDDDLFVSLNISTQLESPFLLSSPGSLKAKAIGRLHSVHIIDAAARDVYQEINNLQKEDTRQEEYVREIDGALDKYSDLPELEKLMLECRKKISHLEEKREKLSSLVALSKEFIKLRENKNLWQEALRKLTGTNSARKDLIFLENNIKIRNELLKLHNQYKKINKKKNSYKNVESKVTEALHGKHLYTQAIEINNKLYSMDSLTKNLKDIKNKIDYYNKILQQVKNAKKYNYKLVFIENKKDIVTQLKKYSIQKNNLTQEKDKIHKILEKVRPVYGKSKELERLRERMDKLNLCREYSRNLKDIRYRLQKGQNYLSERNSELDKLARQYKYLLQSLGRCPTCFSSIDQFTLDSIIIELTKRSGNEN